MSQTMMQLRKVRWTAGLLALTGAGGLAFTPRHAAAQAVAGRGTAAVVSGTVGTQTFATVALPSAGGMVDTELTNVAVPSTLSAEGLVSITTGQVDQTRASVTTTAQAANVNLLSGLITARAVVAVVTSYATRGTATSESNGSALLGLVINGVSYADSTPAPNTTVTLPGVGYVVLNEEIRSGDGVSSTNLTVNMIHVVLTNPDGGTRGEVILASATSGVTY